MPLTEIYVLSDSPTDLSRENTEAIVWDPQLVRYLDKNLFLQHITTSQLNNQLLSLFRHYNPRYMPIEGREYLKISKTHPEINQLIALHRIVYQKTVFDHQPVYLRKKEIPFDYQQHG